MFDKAIVYELDLNNFRQKPTSIIKEISVEFGFDKNKRQEV